MTQLAVFVKSIVKGSFGTIVEAVNGSEDGPPYVKFQLPVEEVSSCFIGKRYLLTIEEYP
jgi:hypothetical protein